ncbi:DNA mismatch repair endonuclease MutL [Candidatus Dependentiae bacterium]|nr:DNA mismatch repair endonuclease MutL [Candidatus Dependentiae bacterium]MCC7415029.1 DNA mismatch repair endonuclease MutL [Campylobacterota bacterium]
MGRIQRLSLIEAQKIAAGQVVERPCNVIKELVENAYDAGASDILLDLQDAGKKSIIIVDNGYGMSVEDARLSIEKHATSKISALDDLAHITTFGFRGEALASIAAVSHMKLVTREAQQLSAIALTIRDGAIVDETPAAHNPGTRIEVADLFYNMPARQKFLKKRETEWNQIQHFLQAFCLSHADLSVTVVHDKNRVLHCPAVASVRDRCAQLWNSTIARDLIDLEDTRLSDALAIQGIVSSHQHARYDRSGIFFFVNNRWVQNSSLARALLKAYQNVLPAGRYPMACIFLTIDPRELDINIHPKKEEIAFLHPRIVEKLIQETVQKALEAHLTGVTQKPVHLNAGLLPDGSIQRMHSFAPYGERVVNAVQQTWRSGWEQQLTQQPSQQLFNREMPPVGFASTLPDDSTAPSINELESRVIPVQTACPSKLAGPEGPDKPSRGIQARKFNPASQSSTSLYAAEQSREQQSVFDLTSPEPHYAQEQLPTEHGYTVIGQYATTYILVERDDALWMVDQHAAHERILYEGFSQANHIPATIQLIAPHIVTLARDQITQLEPHLSILRENGFGVAVCGYDQLMISSTPVHAKNMPLDELIKQCVSWIVEYQSYTAEEFATVMHHHMRAQMACKAAVKAGDILTRQEMIDILEKLEKTPNKLTCPHGRPTGWLISLYEIEKKFKRKA